MRGLIGAFAGLAMVSLGFAAPALAEQPGTMTVATFLAKADSLRAKGPFALMSSDYSLLKAQVTTAAQTYRAKLRDEVAQGRPSSCPPPRAPFTSDDVLAQMKSYPVGERPRITVITVVEDMFRKRYPCPAR